MEETEPQDELEAFLARHSQSAHEPWHQELRGLRQRKSPRAAACAPLSGQEVAQARLERYNRLVEQGHDILYELDPQGRFTYVPPNWERLLGHAPDELLGQAFDPLVHPDDLPPCHDYLRRTLAGTGPAGTVRYRVFHKDGSPRWHSTVGQAIRGADGQVVGFQGLSRDIHERQLARLRLLNMLRLERALALASGELLARGADARAMVLEHARASLGLRRVALLEAHRAGGGALRFVLAEQAKESHLAPWRLQPFLLEQHPEAKWLVARATELLPPVEDGRPWDLLPVMASGELLALLIFDPKDGPGLRQGPQASHLRRLCDLVGLQTQSQRSQQEVERQNAKLRELNLTKDRFFSIISHDLRNPFASMMMLAELQQAYVLKGRFSDSAELASEMVKLTKQSHNLLTNLLEWSRVQTGSLTFRPDRLDLGELLEDFQEFNLLNAKAKGVKLEFDYAQQSLTADRMMLEAILRNLLSNAIKFTPAGGTVRLEVRPYQDSLLFWVRDSGVGMEPQTLARLFRAEAPPTRPGTDEERGSGLGLLLCKEFVELHGGRIKVESRLGKGSTFFFNLPGANR